MKTKLERLALKRVRILLSQMETLPVFIPDGDDRKGTIINKADEVNTEFHIADARNDDRLDEVIELIEALEEDQ